MTIEAQNVERERNFGPRNQERPEGAQGMHLDGREAKFELADHA